MYMKGDWGPWTLDRERLVLTLENSVGHWLYEVDLEQCLDSASMLDWIMQVDGKNPYSAVVGDISGGLVRALNEILHPQANLCSNGQNKKLTRADVARLVKEYGRQAA